MICIDRSQLVWKLTSNYKTPMVENMITDEEIRSVLTQTWILVFETGDKCNLEHAHSKCPISSRSRNLPNFSTDQALAYYQECLHYGFKGSVAFHLYNEPMLEKERILEYISLFKTHNPTQTFMLWTNGFLIDRTIYDEFLDHFNTVFVTIYRPKDLPFFSALQATWTERQNNPKKLFMLKRNDTYAPSLLSLADSSLDDRKDVSSKQKVKENLQPCTKGITIEHLVAYSGEVQLCCVDYNQETRIGNIRTDAPKTILQQYASRWLNISKAIDMPNLCKYCQANLNQHTPPKPS